MSDVITVGAARSFCLAPESADPALFEVLIEEAVHLVEERMGEALTSRSAGPVIVATLMLINQGYRTGQMTVETFQAWLTPYMAKEAA